MNEQLQVAITLSTMIYGQSDVTQIIPAVTGGVLYKPGKRKDIDIILYNKNVPGIKATTCIDAVLRFISIPGLCHVETCTDRVVKCTFNGYDIDFIFPENDADYPEERGPVPPVMPVTMPPSAPVFGTAAPVYPR